VGTINFKEIAREVRELGVRNNVVTYEDKGMLDNIQ
jgi:hypothetical protein